MTTTATTPAISDWNAQFEALKARFPKVKDSVAFAIHSLQSSSDIALDDMKAQAKLHGIRVTQASVNAARRLLDGPGARTPRRSASAAPRRTSRPRATRAAVDVESLIRSTVAKVESQGNAEVERLRKAVRKAIAVLEEVAG